MILSICLAGTLLQMNLLNCSLACVKTCDNNHTHVVSVLASDGILTLP